MPIQRIDASVDSGKYSVFEEESESEMAPTSQSVQQGISWDEFDSKIRSGGDGKYFKTTPRPALISFPQSTPLDIFDRHWASHIRKYVRCTDRCPLCAVGSQPQQRVYFEVVHFEEVDGAFDPKQKEWDCPPGTAKTLRGIDMDEFKGGPLFQNFFTVYASDDGKQNFVTPVKRRDLADPPWNISVEAAQEAVQYAFEHPLTYRRPDMEEQRELAAREASAIRSA